MYKRPINVLLACNLKTEKGREVNSSIKKILKEKLGEKIILKDLQTIKKDTDSHTAKYNGYTALTENIDPVRCLIICLDKDCFSEDTYLTAGLMSRRIKELNEAKKELGYIWDIATLGRAEDDFINKHGSYQPFILGISTEKEISATRLLTSCIRKEGTIVNSVDETVSLLDKVYREAAFNYFPCDCIEDK